MSDKLRIALRSGGRVRVSIMEGNNKDFYLEAVEDWMRLTKVAKTSVKAAELEAAEDPDRLIYDTLERLVQECHINRDARD